MEPSLNTWTVFFLVAAVQGLFLATMIFFRRSKTNNLLGLLVLLFSICLIYYVGYWTRYNSLFSWQIHTIQGLTYTFGPLLYFYIRSDRKRIFFSNWHFVPLGLYLIYFMGVPFFPSGQQLTIRAIQSVLQSSHLVIYTALIFRFTYQNKGFSNGALKLYQWRKKLTWSFLGYSASFACYYVLVWTNTLEVQHDYIISVASAFFIYFIGYHGFQYQEVFKMYENGRYEKSGLNESASGAIMASLRKHVEVHRVYLDSSLRLQDLAEKLGFPQHYISQVINDLHGKNFADFINEYRVKEAKRLLLESEEKKIINIAYDSGFNNKASFNNAFKRFTGMSASEYRENQATIV